MHVNLQISLRTAETTPIQRYVEVTMSSKSVLITGCSDGGIGHSLALEWKSRGYQVFATSRTLSSMAALEEAGIECFEMDVTDPDKVRQVKERVSQKTGGTLNILVNNAGHGMLTQKRN